MHQDSFQNKIIKWQNWIIGNLNILNKFSIETLVSRKLFNEIDCLDKEDKEALLIAEVQIIEHLGGRTKLL